MYDLTVGRQALKNDVLSIAKLNHHVLCFPVYVPSLKSVIYVEEVEEEKGGIFCYCKVP